jgi:hypothetical protein
MQRIACAWRLWHVTTSKFRAGAQRRRGHRHGIALGWTQSRPLAWNFLITENQPVVSPPGGGLAQLMRISFISKAAGMVSMGAVARMCP